MQAAGNIVLLQLDATAQTAYQAPTLLKLRSWLRMRLNDVAVGDWTVEDLDYCINLAYQETVMRTRCHKVLKSAVVVAGTHTYDFGPTFEVFDLQLGSSTLQRADVQQAPVSLFDWDRDDWSLPVRWMHLSGTSIRVHPTPHAYSAGVLGTLAAAPTAGGTGYVVNDVLSITSPLASVGPEATCKVLTIGGGGAVATLQLLSRGGGYTTGAGKATTGGTGTGCTVNISALGGLDAYGYSVDTALISTSEQASVIPGPYAVPAILDRAEAEARKMRPTHPASIALVGPLLEQWRMWTQEVQAAVRGRT